jgi:hypothetical protein
LRRDGEISTERRRMNSACMSFGIGSLKALLRLARYSDFLDEVDYRELDDEMERLKKQGGEELITLQGRPMYL